VFYTKTLQMRHYFRIKAHMVLNVKVFSYAMPCALLQTWGTFRGTYCFQIFCYQGGRHYGSLNNCKFLLGYTASHLMQQYSSRE